MGLMILTLIVLVLGLLIINIKHHGLRAGTLMTVAILAIGFAIQVLVAVAGEWVLLPIVAVLVITGLLVS